MQRISNPLALLVIFQGDGLAIEEGSGVGRREVAHGHGHAAKVFAGCAVGVHIATRKHAHPCRWRVKAVRHVPAVVDAVKEGLVAKVVVAGAKAVPAALVHGAVHHHGLGNAGGHSHGSVQHGRAGCAAAVRHLREKVHIARTQQTGDFVLRHFVHGVRGKAVHFLGVDARIGQSGQRGLHGQTQFGTAGVFGKFCSAQTHNGCATGNIHIVHRNVSVSCFKTGRLAQCR